MKWIVLYCLTLIFLCVTFTSKAQEEFKLADSLFNSENYDEASLLYEYIIFSEGNESATYFRALKGRISSIRKSGDYEDAISYIDKINIFTLPDSIQAYLYYEILINNYMAGYYKEVESRYLMYKSRLISSDFRKNSSLIRTISLLWAEDWDKALQSGDNYISIVAEEKEADSLFILFSGLLDLKNLPKNKNPKTARILSMIIPGSGQVYSGYPIDGLINFTLHAASLAGAGFAFYHSLFVTGWVGGFGILQKLYFGGNKRADILAQQKNRLNKQEFIQPALNFLITLSEKSLP